MRILYLSNNTNYNLFVWLREIGEDVIFYDDKLSTDYLIQNEIDFVVSYNYKYLIGNNIIKLYDKKIINLHISYLPYNRGAHPNVWSFIENTPKGVTIHFIDEGLDTGDILVQKELFFDEDTETFYSTYDKLNKEIQQLFKENWTNIKSGIITPTKQNNEIATLHKKKELEKLLNFFGDNFWNLKISEIKKMIEKERLLEK